MDRRDRLALEDLQETVKQRERRIMKRINAAASLGRTKYWRAIIDIYCDEVNGFKEIGEANKLLAKQQRDSARGFHKAGDTKGSMQLGLVMPPSWLNVLQVADPELAAVLSDSDGDGDRNQQKKLMRMLVKAFPEYQVRQDIVS